MACRSSSWLRFPPGFIFFLFCLGLSTFDLLYLAIGLAIYGLRALSDDYYRSVYLDIMPVAFGVGHISRVGSVFVTMSVTIERYFAIVHPLRQFTGKRYLLLISSVTAVAYNIPKFYELQAGVLNGTNVTIVSGSPLRKDPIYVTYYIFWSKFIFVEVIPYFTILVLNSLIIGKIYKSKQFRKRFVDNDLDPEMTSRQRREANLGLVLISISILFICCQSIKVIPDVYEVVWCRLGQEAKTTCPTPTAIGYIIDLSHLLLAVNSSANFIIYTWRGEKFREVLTITFGLNRCISGCSSAHQRNIEMTEVTSVAACKNIPNGEEKAQELIRSLHKEETLV